MLRWIFGVVLILTLAACGSNTEPQVGSWTGSVQVEPENEATDVPVDTNVVVTYEFTSGQLQDVAVTVDLTPAEAEAATAQVTGTTTIEDGQLIFDPDQDLAYSTTYNATLSGSVTSTADETLSGQVAWSFTTEVDPDAGDGSGGGGGPPAPPADNFDLPADAGGVTVDDEGSGSEDLTITRNDGYDGSISFAATCPAGITLTFDPNPAAGTTTRVEITANVDEDVPNGVYTCTIIATSGDETETSAFEVVVDRAITGFDLPDNPYLITIDESNASGDVDVDVDTEEGFNDTVQLSASCDLGGVALPEGQTGIETTLDPTSFSTAIASVGFAVDAVHPWIPDGIYPCTITGNAASGGEDTTTVDVEVARGEPFAFAGLTGGALVIEVGEESDNLGSAELSLTRTGEGEAEFDADIVLSGTCSEAGIRLTDDPTGIDPSTLENGATDVTVTIATDPGKPKNVDPGYTEACTITATAPSVSPDISATVPVTVVIDRPVDGFFFDPSGDGVGFLVDGYAPDGNTDTEDVGLVRKNDTFVSPEVSIVGTCTGAPDITFAGTLASGDAGAEPTPVTVTVPDDVPNTAPGAPYDCTLEARVEGDDGFEPKELGDVEVVVDRDAPFGFAVEEILVTYEEGESFDGSLDVTRVEGFTGTVDLSATCDDGIDLTFDQAFVVFDDDTASDMESAAFTVTGGTASGGSVETSAVGVGGSYACTVTGTWNEFTDTAEVIITVTP